MDSLCRLSVIIPTSNCRGPAERAVESVLTQADPIGTEIIVADDGSRDGTADHLEAIFGSAIVSKRLTVARLDRSGDRAHARNEGAARASGSFLAFLDPEDHWRPGRLARLEPWLSKHDFILSSPESSLSGSQTDWVRAFLTANWGMPSSAVFRRTLFDELGGFPEGYGGWGLPKRLPGSSEYELWVKALIHLTETKRIERFQLMPNSDVEVSPREGFSLFPVPEALRESLSLVHLARALPRRYWPSLARRFAEMGKSLVKRKNP